MPTMQATENNPFRVLGLPVDATDREIAKRVNELSTLYEFGKSKSYDTDFPFISNLDRSPEAIERAASQIELPEQKLFHANFWFWSGNSIDELVYDVLKDGGVDRATSLWQKQTQDGRLTSKNYSNYKNLALLNLIQSLLGSTPENARLSLAIRQFSAAFTHPSYAGFCANVSGKNLRTEASASEKAFIDELARHLNLFDSGADVARIKSFISSFSIASEDVQSYVKLRFIEAPMHRLEQRLSNLTDALQRDPGNIYENAKYSFYSSITDDLTFLKTVLTEQDLHYESLADRIAETLLRCSTAYFNANCEDDSTGQTIGRSKEITLLAQEVAIGQRLKSEIRDDLLQIEKLGNQGRIYNLANKFMIVVDPFKDPDSMTTSQLLELPASLGTVFTRSRAILTDIKKLGGSSDETYVFLSDLLAGLCLGLSIRYANATNNFSAILPVLRRAKSLDMAPTTRSHLAANLRILESNKAAVDNSSSGGCYIATMAFGSYDAPEVLVLRRFRDDVLAHSCFGRAFIRIYYRISPLIVVALKNRHVANRLIRRCLSKLVEELK